MLILLFFLCYIYSMIGSYIKIFLVKLFLLILTASITQSCSSVKTKTEQVDVNDIIYSPKQRTERRIAERGGDSFLKEMFMGESKKNKSFGNQLSINPHLWQASLDILSSTMPLASVDSNSGIIISDWYNLKGKDNERIKISVLVSTQELRADGVKVSIFKQILKSNTWKNTNINPKIVQKLERKIISKAGSLANTGN